MKDDMISRQAAIDALTALEEPAPTARHLSAIYDCEDAIKALPSAQPDIKQAAKLLSDFIESCPGGDSYLITPDGEELRTDWGYALEGIRLIHDWAERKA